MEMNKVLTIEATSWQSARHLSEFLILWYFRGQSNSTWELSSTMERIGNIYSEILFPEKDEAGFIFELKRRAHHYLAHPPADNDSLEWLSILQHYGCPTRLLDFTHSFYVAAFFAVETAEEDSAIWAINHKSINNSLASKLDLKTTPQMSLYDENSRNINLVQQYIGQEKRSNKLVVDVEPIILTERLSIQQGLFMFPLDGHSRFMDNLFSSFDITRKQFEESVINPIKSDDVTDEQISSASLIKIILPHGCSETVIHDLKKMNITAATLFPGLDGFARSLRIRLHLPIDDDWENRWTDFHLRGMIKK